MALQQTLVLLKPDAVQRNLLGEILHRFERKGMKLIGLKMITLSDALIDEHYSQYLDKQFFGDLKKYMTSAPVIAMVLEGVDVIATVRMLVGPTKGSEAPAGTIRGDFSMSIQTNLIHASDAESTAQKEIPRFFRADELFAYDKIDTALVHGTE